MNLLLIPLFAALNRFSGGGLGWEWMKNNGYRGRPLYYAFLIALTVLYLGFGTVGAIAALSFLLWRLPGWYGAIDAGTDAGSPLRDFAVMSARGLLAFPIFWYTGQLLWLIPFALGIGFFYHLAWHAPWSRQRKDPVADAELNVGVWWGLFLSILLVL